VKVKFNDTEEFLSELRSNPPPSKVVRVTSRYHCHPTLPIKWVFVSASYADALGQIVYLDCLCGEIWHRDSHETRETQTKREGVYEAIETAIAALDLDSRPGTFEE
jgi:hypothetical protein